MNRGDVFWAELIPRSGSEQTGRRPVIIVSNDGFNQTSAWMSIIVVPLSTSKPQAGRGHTVVMIPAGVAGLSKHCVALCHQVTTLDRSKLKTRIGTLPTRIVEELGWALKAALSLD